MFFVLAGCRKADPVIAQVEDIKIRASDIEKEYLSLPAEAQRRLSSPSGRRGLLERFLLRAETLELARQWYFKTHPGQERLPADVSEAMISNQYQSTILEPPVSQEEIARYYKEHPPTSPHKEGALPTPEVWKAYEIGLKATKARQTLDRLAASLKIQVFEERLDKVILPDAKEKQ